MNQARRALFTSAMTQYQAGRISRRQMMRLLGGAGLSVAGLTAAVGIAGAAPMSRGHGAGARFHQDEPMPATPELGERGDGTRVWRVTVGGMDMAALVEVNAFLPGEITINAGDSVFFDFGMGFHNVHILAGDERAPIIVPAEGEGTPAAGDQPQLMINPVVVMATGNQEEFDGSEPVFSGVSFFRDPAMGAFAPTFTQPGTYEVVCDVHPGMDGRIIVQEAGSEYPMEQAAYDEQAAEQLAALIEQGNALQQEYDSPEPTEVDGANVWEVAAGASDGQAEILSYGPPTLEIAAGDTVRWVNHSEISPHTVTFLGGEPPVEDIIPEPQEAGPPLFMLNPVSFYGTENPGTYSGEGLVNSGYIGTLPGLADTFELTFDTPGEYDYYCILHAGPAGEDGSGEFEGMVGKIIVG